jgi:hypothetical protein
MAGFVKLMSNENLPDASPFKGYQLISLPDAGKVEFKRNERGLDTCVIYTPEHDPEEYLMYGNAYILSDSGKTIASHGTNVPCALEPGQEINDAKVAVSALLTLEPDDLKAALCHLVATKPETIRVMGGVIANLARAGNEAAIYSIRPAVEHIST